MKIKLYVGVCFCFTAFLVANSFEIQNPRIMNGEVATEGQFPWNVKVVNMGQPCVKHCGGAIISEKWVLTAAHCIYNATRAIVIHRGIYLKDSNHNFLVATNFTIHVEYDNNTLKNDIGLIYLKSSLGFNDNVEPISLAEDDLKSATEAVVSGWRFVGNSNKDDVLRYITVSTISNDKCIESYGFDAINPGMVCTIGDDPVKNPCKGDGGAPLVVNSTTKPVLVGLFSFLSNLGCESSIFPAGYTRIYFYRSWIKKNSGV